MINNVIGGDANLDCVSVFVVFNRAPFYKTAIRGSYDNFLKIILRIENDHNNAIISFYKLQDIIWHISWMVGNGPSAIKQFIKSRWILNKHNQYINLML